jgi:hypothetical protein
MKHRTKYYLVPNSYYLGYFVGWLHSRRHWLKLDYWRGYLAGYIERR